MTDMYEARVRGLWREITLRLIERGTTVTTMESCTAGQLASLITDTEGASAIMKGAFVTYSNVAKVMQGVPAETIDRFGVYSDETAVAMARACRQTYAADIGIGVTGTMGNADPGNSDSVPGQAHFAIDCLGDVRVFCIEIPPQPDRLTYKLRVAEAVGEKLKEAIA